MRKRVFFGAVLALVAILMLSCNKNRFDFDQLETVEGSGQWKLPIGSVSTTLGDVLNQFGENDLITYDENGNLQISYSFQLNDIIKGSSFLTLGTLNFKDSMAVVNPIPGIDPSVIIDTTVYFQQVLVINADSAAIESAVIKTCTMVTTFQGNMLSVKHADISSPDIFVDGDTLFTTDLVKDLAGATFRLHNEAGEADSTLIINYKLDLELYGNEEPQYKLLALVGLNDLRLQELKGYIDHFTYDFSLDTAFSLPLGNVDGQLSLVGAQINIKEKNTFEGLYAKLQLQQAELYGGNTEPSSIFDCPYELNIVPANNYVDITDGGLTVDFGVNSQYNGVRFQGIVDFNPNGAEQLITFHDTSSLSLGIDAYIPMQFNVPGVTYIDTLDLNLGDITAPSLVKEIDLSVLFDSQIPFDLNAQFYTYKSQTGQITGELLNDELHVKGSYDGNTVKSEGKMILTNELLQRLLDADKLIMQFGVNTDNHDVILNLDNGLGVTLKADVIYGGSVDIND